MKKIAAVLLAGMLAVAAASCAEDRPGPFDGSGSANTGTGSASAVASGLEAPWSIAFFEGTPLVSERDSARILELDGEGRTREVAVVDGVAGGGEGGLLGIAVREGYLYAYFTAGEENRIERFAIEGEAGALRLGEPEMVFGGIPSAGFHNGGRIAFGPDGMLYATTGDAGDRENAQDPGSLAGKILRMTPEGGVPSDNPFPESPVYSLGHRNPQGIAWGSDGTMYASEFGQDAWDELNVIEAGENYGWPEVEGIAGREEFVDPVQQWTPEEASPSGIAVVGETIYVANLRGQRLRAVPIGDLTSSTEYFTGEYGRLRDVTVAPDGALWLLTNNTDGRGDPGPEDDRILAANLD
jgi:glucose/arabinose dehydrogenase